MIIKELLDVLVSDNIHKVFLDGEQTYFTTLSSKHANKIINKIYIKQKHSSLLSENVSYNVDTDVLVMVDIYLPDNTYYTYNEMYIETEK